MARTSPTAFLTPAALPTSWNRVAHPIQKQHLVPRRARTSMAVQQVHTAADLRVAASGSDPQASLSSDTSRPLLVFSFVTEGCRACKYAQTGFKRLASEFDKRLKPGRGVHFYEVNISSARTQKLGEHLGVQAVPTFQVYAYKTADAEAGWQGGFGVLDELVGPRVVGKVRQRLMHYSSDQFDLEDYVFADEK